jgi:archaellum component FlaC
MSKELDILNDIYSNICNDIQHIESSKKDILRIKDNIKKLDNNYFETKCTSSLLSEYISMFDSVEICDEVINNLDTLRLFIKNKLNNICNHEWIHDTVDLKPDMSLNICYCVKCEVSKK